MSWQNSTRDEANFFSSSPSVKRIFFFFISFLCSIRIKIVNIIIYEQIGNFIRNSLRFVSSDEFQCTDGQCITKFHVCDWRNDCSNFSDEINCQAHVCDPDSYRCASGTCIPKTWECDGDQDCRDGSDEASDRCNVLKCPSEMFQCANKRCLDHRLVCDSIDDCGDSSDEAKCSNEFSREDGPCPENAYKCHGTEKCISLKLRWDGVFF